MSASVKFASGISTKVMSANTPKAIQPRLLVACRKRTVKGMRCAILVFDKASFQREHALRTFLDDDDDDDQHDDLGNHRTSPTFQKLGDHA